MYQQQHMYVNPGVYIIIVKNENMKISCPCHWENPIHLFHPKPIPCILIPD